MAQPKTQPGVRDSKGKLQAAISHRPNDDLAKVIVAAWKDDSFKKQLLTFPAGELAVWKKGADYEAALARTRNAIQSVVNELQLKSPIVLTPSQYAKGYRKRNDDEIVFVLPDAALAAVPSFAAAKIAMAVTIDGM